MATQRLDDALVARGLAASVDEARRLSLAGAVISADRLLTKPGMSIATDAPLALKSTQAHVSRGGDKLAGALDDLTIDPAGWRCIDIGASTGGFTDCLLKHGARQVTAVDVAYGQMAWSLRTDERVVLMERTNIRELSPEAVGAPFDLAVVDLSFIGLARLLPHLRSFIEPQGALLVLIKPQFELPPSAVDQGGVVTDRHAHLRALDAVLAAAREAGLSPQGLVSSRLKGPAGNIEFFLWARIGGIPATIDPEAVVRSVWMANDRPTTPLARIPSD
ncbi:MAG: TlyA family RNA methyltransferase [Coriobacteriales bacterium]|jgi:23S rRNA (cytidine1920-2'-O)/16S rRNA (cytidine1409-2'-O)-methyltransferase|nr:TlyA family RNA methyltransferase [Coriobacteriales bacterium]